jgi:hypothetical protein
MRRWLKTGVSLLAALSLGFLGFSWLFPPPQKVIRKQLVAVARLASFDVNEAPLAKLANSQKLGSYFADRVELALDLPGRGQQVIGGREELIQTATSARMQLSSLNIQFPDIVVTVASDKRTAEANVTVKAIIGGQREMYIEEMRFSLEKIRGDWLIHRIESVNTLK